ncbi:HD domain-containing phosphohydrolase [Desulfovibrio oxyclinae]|uniref:HD domain-containing phosphohydrolase n=1 Tax=Desulfovibrio oxyclinae TaxID=63560 RepID=UPI0003716E66|nr:HD domain-containing phosphohydrolase [Desulfovibrio oxyclinae]
MTNNTVLFVDDEPNILASFRRSLGRKFSIDLAQGPEEALEKIQKNDPYAVVVSDLKMPKMNGIDLLTRVKSISPDTVRVILTGHANLDSAISAVNEGSVFRFLTKPCDTDILVKTVNASIKQYRLVTAEKELLRGTLRGSVKLLTDILALVTPEAFGRTERIKQIVLGTATEAKLDNPWRYELAAMLSMIGYISVDPEILDKKFNNEELTPEEEQMLTMHSAVATGLLANIPRMQEVIDAIASQDDRFDENPDQPVGGRLLRLAGDFESLERSGLDKDEAMDHMRSDEDRYDPMLLRALERMIFAEEGLVPMSLTFKELRVGMLLTANVTTEDGVLLMAKGQELNEVGLLRLQNFARNNSIKEPIEVRVSLDRVKQSGKAQPPS